MKDESRKNSRIVKGTEDTYADKDTAHIARLSAGAALTALNMFFEQLKSRETNDGVFYDTAFTINRPPGHHASSTIRNGFCSLNNVAICANVFLQKAKQEFPNLLKKWKVAIVDWDVHHGDVNVFVSFYWSIFVLFIFFFHYRVLKKFSIQPMMCYSFRFIDLV